MEKFFNEINIIYGCLTALFTYMFGELWFLFVGFLILNITDWFTGWGASRKENKESSSVGAKGILKKVCYWVVIAVAFYIGVALSKMGAVIGADLRFLQAVGWFVLANYIINEIRSILENCVRIGIEVPEILVKGLDVTSNLVDKIGGESVEQRDNESTIK